MENETTKTVVRGILLVLSIFLLALCYNLFFLPNELVIGGVSGIAILVNKLFDINSTIFIYSCNAILLIISYFTLGKEKTQNSVVGSLLYPLMITFSEPIANYMLPYVQFEEFLLTALIAALVWGFSSGMVFRYNYSTGGCDIMVSIATKYFKLPEGKSMLFINILIIMFGGYVFGLELMVYALLVLYISSLVLDKVIFDISNSKVFYVFTRKPEEIKSLILTDFKSGFTILPTKGGYSEKEGDLIMTVLPNREYYHFKNRVKKLDKRAFFIICDCYESQGGYKKKNIPYV